MDEKISGISLKTMFQHEGYGCLCAKDTVNTSPDEAPTVTLKVCPDISTQLLFSYAPKDGLNMTGVSGGIHEKNILGKLLALPKDDVDKHIEFIEKYGFLYPLPANEYTAVEASDLIDIINRIKSTIRLYSCINKKDYKGVLIHVVYLLFASVTELRIGDDVFSTCSHHFKNLLDSYNLFPDLSREPEVAANGTYSVDDAFLGKKNAVDISFYNAVRSGADTNLQGSKDPWFKNLMAMYMGCKDVDEETRYLTKTVCLNLFNHPFFISDDRSHTWSKIYHFLTSLFQRKLWCCKAYAICFGYFFLLKFCLNSAVIASLPFLVPISSILISPLKTSSIIPM